MDLILGGLAFAIMMAGQFLAVVVVHGERCATGFPDAHQYHDGDVPISNQALNRAAATM
jgi:hypothetical protein